MFSPSRVTRKCPVCSSTDSVTGLKLSESPLEDSLQASQAAAAQLTRYPMELMRCLRCNHLYLSDVVEPDLSYANYFFSSSRSPGLQETMERIADILLSICELKAGDSVLDIGSNDGSLLKIFRSRGHSVLGIEPSQLQSEKANADGIPTINAYFSAEKITQYRPEFSPKLTTIHNVLANLENFQEFLDGVCAVMDEDAFLSIVTGYHPDQFQASMFDWIYHEHLSYFSGADFEKLLDSKGLVVRLATRLAYKGGSLHLIVQKVTGPEDRHSSSFAALVAWERWSKVAEGGVLTILEHKIRMNREKLRDLRPALGSSKLVGFGCSHSTTTLAINMGIEKELAWLVDDNPDRHGLFSPIGGLEIRPPDSILEVGAIPVILAWQHDWRIIERLRTLGFRGNILRVMPEVVLAPIEELT